MLDISGRYLFVKFLSKAFLLCVVCSGEDLSDLAVEHSICPSKDEGGMLGWVRKGQMVCCCLEPCSYGFSICLDFAVGYFLWLRLVYITALCKMKLTLSVLEGYIVV